MSTPPLVFVPAGPPPDPPERPEGLPPLRRGADAWRPWSALIALALALTVPLVVGLIAGVTTVAAGGDVDDLPSGLLIGVTYVQQFGFVLVPLGLAGFLASRTRSVDFGIVRPRRIGMALLILGAVYLAYLLFAAGWTQLLGIDEKDSLEELGVNDSTVNLVLVLVMVCIGAPVSEELLFRGYIFRALRNWRGVWPAALISGALFGGIHLGGSPAGFIVPLCVLGVLLALLYHWTGSLLLPVGLHAVNNAIAFSALQKWIPSEPGDAVGWQVIPTVIGGVTASVGIVWLIGRLIERRGRPAGPKLSGPIDAGPSSS